MEKIKNIFYHYMDQTIDWYSGLEKMYQYGILYLLIVIGFFIVAFFILSRITR